MSAGSYGNPRTESEPAGVLPLCLLQDRLQPAGFQSLDIMPSSSSSSSCALHHVFQMLIYFHTLYSLPVFYVQLLLVHSWVHVEEVVTDQCPGQ